MTLKVDKAVCTNDCTTLEDIARAVRFESVFKTLVQNKIHAIKKECEERERRKRRKKSRKSFGRILFGGRIFGDKGKAVDATVCDTSPAAVMASPVADEIVMAVAPSGGDTGSELPPAVVATVEIAGRDDHDHDRESIKSECAPRAPPMADDTRPRLCHSADSLVFGTQKASRRMRAPPRRVVNVCSETAAGGAPTALDDCSTATGSWSGASKSLRDTSVTAADTTFQPCPRILAAKSVSAQCSPLFPRQSLDETPATTTTTTTARTATLHQRAPPSPPSPPPLPVQFSSLRQLPRQMTFDSSMQPPPPPVLSQPTSRKMSLAYSSAYSSPHPVRRLSQVVQSPYLPHLLTRAASKGDATAAFMVHRLMASAKVRDSHDSVSMVQVVQIDGAADCADDAVAPHAAADEEAAKRKRLHRKAHRYSEPVLVYPTPSGLQHCILTRPPNQPIQFHYDDDFVYDVSLQIEPDRSADLEVIGRGHRKHCHTCENPHKLTSHHHNEPHGDQHGEHNDHHHHHHHHHHSKHGKHERHKHRKILIRNLNEKTVKVIDPDEMPQRARWTIIATAFLLLLMCLALVGVTLRMAPIIDDMVRQENERLMQESMNRARFARNFTDATPLLAAGEEIP